MLLFCFKNNNNKTNKESNKIQDQAHKFWNQSRVYTMVLSLPAMWPWTTKSISSSSHFLTYVREKLHILVAALVA